MFFTGKKKKKKAPQRAPAWFMWLMGLFVAYALITNMFTDNVEKVQEQASTTITDMDYFNFPVVRDGGMGAPLRPIFSRDIIVGEGRAANCWHSALVDYKLYNSNGELVEDTSNSEPVRLTIGQNNVPLALERGTLGMRIGGERAVTAHPTMLFDNLQFNHPVMKSSQYGGYIIKVQEVAIPANLPLSDLGLRVYDDEVGTGALAQCTDDVRFQLRAWSATGKPLIRKADFRSIMVHLGEGSAPYAIERGLLGMRVGGKRTLIIPPGYLKPVYGEKEAVTLEDILQPDDAVVTEASENENAEAGAENNPDEVVLEIPVADGSEDATTKIKVNALLTEEDKKEIAESNKTTLQKMRAIPPPKFDWSRVKLPEVEVIIL
ncbi:MAG: FKBP-type peptidyl-prolyl cis-trans isomerase [Alphaproteobacteria bacterium]|nr:FKBP-type peptidyl-prolyl cis-trans isomerase [Alphaproteobacteria bacterium]